MQYRTRTSIPPTEDGGVEGPFVDTDAERFEESMAPFEEETGIEVEYERSGDFESLIAVRAEGGDPPEGQNALEIMIDVWKNEEYVLGGEQSILITPFGDAIHPLLEDPTEEGLERIDETWPAEGES